MIFETLGEIGKFDSKTEKKKMENMEKHERLITHSKTERAPHCHHASLTHRLPSPNMEPYYKADNAARGCAQPGELLRPGPLPFHFDIPGVHIRV